MTSPAKNKQTNIKQSPIIQDIVKKVNTPPPIAKPDPAASSTAPKTGGFLSRMFPPMQANDTQFKPGKYFTAMFILLIGLYVIQFGLIYIDNITHGSLNKPVFLNLGIIQLNPLNTIFIALIFGMYWMLIRFNILPRSGMRRQNSPIIPTFGRSAAQNKTKTVSVPAAENVKTSKKTTPIEIVDVTDTTPSEPTAGDELYNRYLSQSRAMARKKKNR